MTYSNITDNTVGEFFMEPDASFEFELKDTLNKNLWAPVSTTVEVKGDKVKNFVKTISDAKKNTNANGSCFTAIGDLTVDKDEFDVNSVFDNGLAYCDDPTSSYMTEAEAKSAVKDSIYNALNKSLTEDFINSATDGGSVSITTKEEVIDLIADVASLEDIVPIISNVKYGTVTQAPKKGQLFIYATSQAFKNIRKFSMTQLMSNCCGVKSRNGFALLENEGIILVNLGPKTGTDEKIILGIGGLPVIGREDGSVTVNTSDISAMDKATVADLGVSVDDAGFRKGKVVYGKGSGDGYIFQSVRDYVIQKTATV